MNANSDIPKKKVTYHDKEFIIELLDDKHIQIDGYIFSPEVVQHSENQFRVSFGKFTFMLENIDGKLFLEGEEVDINIKPYMGQMTEEVGAEEPQTATIKAPIPGKVLQILANRGDHVEKDQEILILEAMKMRNRILAPISGKVTEIAVEIGETVSQDQSLLQITK